jgi:polar amino acid transport system permease protein
VWPVPRGPQRYVPWWALALTLCALVLIGLGLADPRYRAIFGAVGLGLAVTLRVTVISFVAALLLGTFIAIGLISRRRWLSEALKAYVEVMRGVPMLVLLYYIAFAIGPAIVSGYGALFASLIEVGLLPALSIRDFGFEWRAILALTLCYSAFIAEVVRGGIEAVSVAQTEGALALGLSRWQTLRLVVLPQAFKTMLPPLGNDLISMLKDSSLVSVLGVGDITQIGKTYSAATFLFFETYTVVAFFYLAMTISLSLLVRRLERRLRPGGAG